MNDAPDSQESNPRKDTEATTDSEVWLGAQKSRFTHFREWQQVNLLLIVSMVLLVIIGMVCCSLFAAFLDWAQTAQYSVR